MAQNPEKYLMDWLNKKPERTAKPCIAYLYHEGRRKRCIERVPLPQRARKEVIASTVTNRILKMRRSQSNKAVPSQDFVAVAVHLEGTIACWSGDKWVKTRTFNGDKDAVKSHRGRLALVMLMDSI
ncbi:MAG: hypothetical protein AAGC93_26820 [Cyanobacteria bacterium P01_F01_bin.53]